MAECLRIQEPEVFPSVVVGNIFLHLRQSKLLLALSRKCGERRSPFLQGWKLLPFYLNCTFLGVTGGGAEGDEDTVRKEAKITFRRDKCPDYITRFKKAMTSIFFFPSRKDNLDFYFIPGFPPLFTLISYL